MSGTGTSSGGERMVPLHCPYCAEEDLRPYDEQPGAWQCAACLRAFTVRLIATGVQPA